VQIFKLITKRQTYNLHKESLKLQCVDFPLSNNSQALEQWNW